VSAETPDPDAAAAIQATAPVDLDRVRSDIEACARSQRALTEHLLAIDPVDPFTPSHLPGWTIAHVLSHIARNADSALRMLDGLPQYWKGAESRAADIDLGATRAWHELVEDVVESSAAVEARLREVSDWTGSIQTGLALRPKAMLPVTRRREVEVHRADLGLGYDFADMPADYVRTDLRLLTMQWTARQPMGLTQLPDAVRTLSDADRLAWLFGRIDVSGVEPARVY
jgi:maleylpyruvate isomerase